jgi:hypothetical protein
VNEKQEPDPTTDSQGKRLPLSPCPKCGYKNDAATPCNEFAEENGRPRPDDISVCLGCATVLQFNHDMTTRAVELDDIPDISDDTKFQVRRIQQTMRRLRQIGKLKL